MHAHSSTDSTAPLAPRTPGARSWVRASRSTLTASSVSSRIQAAPPTLAGSAEGSAGDPVQAGDCFRSLAERVSACPDPYPVLLEHGWPASARPAAGSPRASRPSRAARTLAQASGSPVWWATVAASPVASHATAGSLGDASAATERSVSSASAFRFDHSSDQPMFNRAAMRRSGSDVSVSTLPASSRTQSAWPAGRARAEAASSRRAWSSLARAELGGTFQGAGRGGGAATALRPGRAVLQAGRPRARRAPAPRRPGARRSGRAGRAACPRSSGAPRRARRTARRGRRRPGQAGG